MVDTTWIKQHKEHEAERTVRCPQDFPSSSGTSTDVMEVSSVRYRRGGLVEQVADVTDKRAVNVGN